MPIAYLLILWQSPGDGQAVAVKGDIRDGSRNLQASASVFYHSTAASKRIHQLQTHKKIFERKQTY